MTTPRGDIGSHGLSDERGAQNSGRVTTDPLIGRWVDGFTIDSLVGRGGMGVVYRAMDDLGKPVALKLIAPELAQSTEFRDRFLREAQIALEHPNIIPVYGAGEDGGLLYIAMHLVDGVNLKQLIARGGLTPKRTVSLIAQAASALDFAHANEMVHRDVKPQNILIEDRSDRVYLTDFGLVKRASSDSSFTSSGHLVGSAHYVPPEQIEGSGVDGRADVYALGCVVYECLIGRVPYEREEELSVIWAHVNAAVPRPSEALEHLPTAVDAVVAKAMAKSPDDRYLTAGDMAAALADALGVPESRVRSPWAAPQLARSRSARHLRRLTPAPLAVPRSLTSARGALIGAAVMVALVAGALGLSEGSPSRHPASLTRADTLQPEARNSRGNNAIGSRQRDRPQRPETRKDGSVNAAPAPLADLASSAPINRGSSSPALNAIVPDGSALAESVIVFTSNRRYPASQRGIAASMDLYIMKGDGSRLTSLYPEDPDRADSFPVLSPCGHLSFVRYYESGSSSRDGYELFNLAPDGTVLYRDAGWQGYSNQDWSPDCSKFVYTREGTLVEMAPDGSDRRVLFTDQRYPANPRWSPDGTRIVFDLGQDSKTPSANSEIYTIDSDGTDLTRLTSAPQYETKPVWSPDGRKIAFRRGAIGAGGDGEIWVMNADGSNPRKLTDATGDDMPVGWSPDGEHIIFFTDRESRASAPPALQGDIYIMDADGTNERDLIPDGGGHEGWLTWQPPVFRSISARVDDGRLVGRLKAMLTSCADGQDVHIQRKHADGWETMGSITATSAGRFALNLRSPGVYRARLPLSSAEGSLVCGISASRAHVSA